MILVTGGTGLVGSHLLFELLKSETKVRAIYRHPEKLKKLQEVFEFYTDQENAQNLLKKIEWVKADINDIPSLEEAFLGINKVYHCAALVSFKPGDERELRKTNITGTANIVNLCIANKIEKLCYVSSIASLGKSLDNSEITEEISWNPEDNHTDYAISKYGAEIEVWRGSQEGLKVMIVNPGIIIGPGFWQEGSGQLFSRINKGLKFYFTKSTGFIGVKDVVNAMQKLMNSEIKNEKFILVAENLSFKEVLQHVAQNINKPIPDKALKKWMLWLGWFFQKMGSIFGFKRQITRDTVKTMFEDRRYSNQKIKKEINFNFTPISEVIAETGEIFTKQYRG